MHILAFMQDGRSGSEPEWGLFPMCVYIPALVTIAAVVAIRWNPRLVVAALVVAGIGAYAILTQLGTDRRTRESSELQIKVEIEALEKLSGSPQPGDPLAGRDLVAYAAEKRQELSRINERTIDGVPPLRPGILAAVWVSALSPFLLVAIIFFTLNPAVRNKRQPA